MQRITYFERQIIQSGLRVDKSVGAIARCLGRDHRVIQREIDRNNFDNGGESATHVRLRDDFDLQTFHCDAFASWQKGGVKNINGLLRQYLPRTKIIGTMSETELGAIQEKLNNRPKKSLNFLSPNQIIAQEVGQ